jgi:hypothetical protein
MGQLGFFDAEKRLAALSANEVKKSSAGRKPVDAMVLFRMLVLYYTKSH